MLRLKLDVPPADEVYVMPATQGQIRFWSLDQMHPGNPALNMPLMWQCRGELNVDLLAMAFTQAVRRHEMLRTTFAMVGRKTFADHREALQRCVACQRPAAHT